jgi:MoaA/NifB/PqqE/SkfB family radical SAM enzyme
MNPILFPITYQCNLDCTYCSEKSKRKDIVDVEKGIELITKRNNDWVFITGGEPLTVPNIVEICQKLKKSGKKVGLTTNGTIHKFEILNVIDRIGVSIDGDEEFTDKNRGKGTYKKALNFLKEASKYSCEKVIMTTVLERDEKQEKHLEELCDKYKVDYFQITLCKK